MRRQQYSKMRASIHHKNIIINKIVIDVQFLPIEAKSSFIRFCFCLFILLLFLFFEYDIGLYHSKFSQVTIHPFCFWLLIVQWNVCSMLCLILFLSVALSARILISVEIGAEYFYYVYLNITSVKLDGIADTNFQTKDTLNGNCHLVIETYNIINNDYQKLS